MRTEDTWCRKYPFPSADAFDDTAGITLRGRGHVGLTAVAKAKACREGCPAHTAVTDTRSRLHSNGQPCTSDHQCPYGRARATRRLKAQQCCVPDNTRTRCSPGDIMERGTRFGAHPASISRGVESWCAVRSLDFCRSCVDHSRLWRRRLCGEAGRPIPRSNELAGPVDRSAADVNRTPYLYPRGRGNGAGFIAKGTPSTRAGFSMPD